MECSFGVSGRNSALRVFPLYLDEPSASAVVRFSVFLVLLTSVETVPCFHFFLVLFLLFFVVVIFSCCGLYVCLCAFSICVSACLRPSLGAYVKLYAWSTSKLQISVHSYSSTVRGGTVHAIALL